MCRKNRDFVFDHKKVEKDSNYLIAFYGKTCSNIITSKGLMNTLPELIVRSIFSAANKFNPAIIEEDQIHLKTQHEEKLYCQELIQAKSLEKAENACVKAALWHKQFERLD